MAEARQSITLNTFWGKISNDLEQLFKHQTIRYSQWMHVYTCIFDYCTEKNSNADDLYETFPNFLTEYLESLNKSFNDLRGQEIIECYIKLWQKYQRSSKILHGICSYLHRHYVKREQDCGNWDVEEIYQMAMRLYHEVISKLYYEQIAEICLSMIRSERDQKKIDTELIRNMIHIYVALDIDGDDNYLLHFYEKYFEDQFLNDTAIFYRVVAENYLQQHSMMDYLRKISEYFHEEIHRVATYLHSSTVPKLTNTLEKILIHNQLSAINDEAKSLIRDEKIEELNLLYQTVNRIENGTTELKNLLEDHIHRIALEQINRIPPNDLTMYIQTIADLYKRYLLFIEKAFDNDQSFLRILDRIFRKFVNQNAFIQAMEGITSMAQSLAHHCDKLLRKEQADRRVNLRQKEPMDLEMVFPQIEILLYFMQEKDIFEKFYSKLLAKRLIGQKSISNDYEKSMILTIQNTCGLEYVSKMKQMCQDMETSEHLLKQYCTTEHIDHQSLKNLSSISPSYPPSSVNFNILILNSNAWLFSRPSDIILPNKLQTIFNHFTEFYQRMHSGRKLTWLYQHSKGELQTYFTKNVYTLQVSMYQMIILLLFNNSPEWTVENIHDHTQITMDLLLQILNVLLKSKVLICAQGDDLDLNCKIRLSNEFTSDKYCVNLNVPVKSIKENEEKVFVKKIDQDRVVVIQAAIVRIMKSHQAMNQHLLIQTVIEQLNPRFHPNIAMIKECINMLIQREYLERSLQDCDLIRYMS